MNPELMQMLSSGGFGGAGMVNFEAVEQLRKALEAGYGTDAATLTGGASLRVQSLEPTLLATIQENEHFKLFRMLQKSNAIATVDEWTEQSSVGGFLGGATNTETGTIQQSTGAYKRRVGMVKFLTTRRQVSFAVTLQQAIAEAEAVEQMSGAMELLTSAEFLSFEGDDAVVPTEFPGIEAQILGQNLTDHVIDARGAALEDQDLVADASAIAADFQNFGRLTDIFFPLSVQADFDKGLDPAFRVPLTNVGESLKLGAPVIGIRTSNGNIATQSDVFVRDEKLKKPFDVLYADTAAAQAGIKPTVSGAHGAQSNSLFDASWAGNYYYGVAGVNKSGQSGIALTAVQAVASGEGATLTITASGGGLETGYVLYRSRKGGTNAVSDMREFKRIPATAGGTTVYVDKNADLPGAAKAYLLNNTPGAKAITWRQFLPMMKFPLYPTDAAIVPWAQLLFGYLRLGKAKHHVIIKNIVPNGAAWKPQG